MKEGTPLKGQEVLYKKVGRRYVPVGVTYERYDYFPIGSHLVVVSDDRRARTTSYRYDIDPDFAPLAAALRVSADKIVDIVQEASRASIAWRSIVTPEQRAAWAALEDSFGGAIVHISHPSANEAATKIVTALVDTVIAGSAPRSHGE